MDFHSLISFLEKTNVIDRIKETMDICNMNSMNKYYHKNVRVNQTRIDKLPYFQTSIHNHKNQVLELQLGF